MKHSDSASEGMQPSDERCWPVIAGASTGRTLTTARFNPSRLLLSGSAISRPTALDILAELQIEVKEEIW